MPSIRLTISPQHAQTIVGENLDAKVTVMNTGPTPFEVDGPDTTSPFEFILRLAGDTRNVRTLSARAAMVVRSGGDRVPPPPTTKVAVAPGASLVYADDLADYATSPVPPGSYLLSVALGAGASRIESPPVPLMVGAPRVRALATVAAADGVRLGLAFVHEPSAGSRVVFQQESAGKDPFDAVRYRRWETVSAPMVAGVALAAEPEDNAGVRWFAWLQDDSLGAGVAQGNTVFKRIEPVRLGLRSSVLLPLGWQPSVQSASFVALGADQQGQVTLAVGTFLAREGIGSVKTIPLGLTKIPEHCGVRWPGQGDGGEFHLIAAEERNGATTLLHEVATLSGDRTKAGAVLLERREPLVALTPSAAASGKNDHVDALFGPVGEEARMTLVRLSLIDRRIINEWTFSAPDSRDKSRPSVWALAPRALPDPVVLAKLGDSLLVWRSSRSGWSTLVEKSRQVEFMRLEVLGGKVWAVWADPLSGIRFSAVP